MLVWIKMGRGRNEAVLCFDFFWGWGRDSPLPFSFLLDLYK